MNYWVQENRVKITLHLNSPISHFGLKSSNVEDLANEQL